ncbi:hypothetical protein QR680_007011 [Steinernema hermaphroditum]|uniref:Nanos-type domain-containing protein n=1 Tax=Steinernema hermaphroditum TaxID=289476 RepID=A0AA39LY27_9BILA|nr:hypothetical protein QR680_007011 [Steinernema hermaphroditum]
MLQSSPVENYGFRVQTIFLNVSRLCLFSPNQCSPFLFNARRSKMPSPPGGIVQLPTPVLRQRSPSINVSSLSALFFDNYESEATVMARFRLMAEELKPHAVSTCSVCMSQPLVYNREPTVVPRLRSISERANVSTSAIYSREPVVMQRLRSVSERGTLPTCVFCKARGIETSYGHTNKNCPEIARMRPCMKCGASGFDNHTLKYCPRNDLNKNRVFY